MLLRTCPISQLQQTSIFAYVYLFVLCVCVCECGGEFISITLKENISFDCILPINDEHFYRFSFQEVQSFPMSKSSLLLCTYIYINVYVSMSMCKVTTC